MSEEALRRGRWTALELARVREMVPRKSLENVAERLGRTPDAVRQVLPRVFDAPRRLGPLTESEIELLMDGYGIYELDDLAVLCGRTAAELSREIERFGSETIDRPWSRAEQAFLRRAYGRRQDCDLALILRRHEVDVTAEAKRQGLGKDRRQIFAQGRPMPRWTEPEIERLRADFADRPTREIAKLLGRSTQSVQSKAKQLGLKKSPNRRAFAARAAAEARHHDD
ncbi:MAG: hypothetical protein AAF196_08170 [Planctomycetota bacterium]